MKSALEISQRIRLLHHLLSALGEWNDVTVEAVYYSIVLNGLLALLATHFIHPLWSTFVKGFASEGSKSK